jgi:hypothetical protein
VRGLRQTSAHNALLTEGPPGLSSRGLSRRALYPCLSEKNPLSLAMAVQSLSTTTKPGLVNPSQPLLAAFESTTFYISRSQSSSRGYIEGFAGGRWRVEGKASQKEIRTTRHRGKEQASRTKQRKHNTQGKQRAAP